MLNKTAVQYSFGLTEEFNRLTLNPVATISTLIGSSSGAMWDHWVNDDTLWIDQEELVKASTHKQLDGESLHDKEVAAIVNLGSRAIMGMFNLARNVANPLCIEVAAEVNKVTSEIVEDGLNVNLVSVFEPALAKNQAFIGLFDRYSTNSTYTPPDNLPIRELGFGSAWLEASATKKAELLSTGIASIDAGIPELVAYLETGTQLMNPFELNAREGFHEVAVKFLMLIHLRNNIPEGIDLPLERLNAILAGQLSALGGRLNVLIERYSRMERNKQLFMPDQSVRFSNEVRLWGPSYNAWLARGGKPEIIIGMIRSQDKPEFNADRLLERADYYLDAYKKALISERAQRISKVSDIRRRTITRFFENYVNTEVDAAHRVEANNRLREYVRKNVIGAEKDVMDYCRRLVCEVFFPGTAVYKLLTELQSACDANPDLDVREAAEIVVINYVGDWLMTLVEITSFKE